MKRINTLLGLFICTLFYSQSLQAQDLIDFRRMKSVTPTDVKHVETFKDNGPKTTAKGISPEKRAYDAKMKMQQKQNQAAKEAQTPSTPTSKRSELVLKNSSIKKANTEKAAYDVKMKMQQRQNQVTKQGQSKVTADKVNPSDLSKIKLNNHGNSMAVAHKSQAEIEDAIGKKIISQKEYDEMTNIERDFIKNHPETFLVSDKSPLEILRSFKK